jgi:hypothetical protein
VSKIKKILVALTLFAAITAVVAWYAGDHVNDCMTVKCLEGM